ncbi:DUF4239 domain-containing protein [Mycobacterium mantenii]|uniref:DUF4239 domain-containing protein n=1 Tax=Mycobacterium mantenii TaxID=560555 RepID=A0A1A2TDD2_MYCNT|nr:DUF4239 domain-containing protein [Mycobacterium mantenii]OBH43191.1 hypothetical protein A5688_14850 [Mycobacterium mantenii]OBH74418.1 hypothetical protein A5683_23640 [Mycobacterium mantenii]
MSNLPAWLVLVGLLVIVAGGAVLAQIIVRRRYPGLAADAHNDATRFAFGVICLVYAFFVGFMASGLWSQINAEDEQVRTEGAAAVQLARDSTVFDKPDSDRIRQALLEYEHAALAEWPVVADGRAASPEADTALHRVYLAYQQVQPHTDIQKAFLSTSLANLDRASQARTARVIETQTNSGPPWSIWTVILLTAGMVVGCSVIYGVKQPRMDYIMVATVGVLVAADLFLILELAHPYLGEVATSPQPLRNVVAVLTGPAT